MATTKITIYDHNGHSIGVYHEAEVLTTIGARALQFKYNEKRDDKVVVRTITTTLPYFAVEEFEHSGKFSV